jgi:hypothetical protein
MSTTANTPQGTGSSAQEAASAIESLLTGEADTQGEHEGEGNEHEHDEHDESGEAHTETETDEHGEHEAETETEETDEPEAGAAEKPQKFSLDVDGQKTEVTLDELTKGYLRQSDYTRKTTELATQRQTLANEVAQTQQERTLYAQALEQANALLTQLQPQEPDWNALYQADPAQYAATREMWRSYQEQRQAVEQQRQIVGQRAQQEQRRNAQTFVEQQKGQLLEALPSWKDSKVAEAERGEIRKWAADLGFSAQELNTIADHRAIVIMRKAMLFDRAQTTKANLKPTANGNATTGGKVKPATPGTAATRPNSVSSANKARAHAAKTGKVNDAAAAIEQFL